MEGGREGGRLKRRKSKATGVSAAEELWKEKRQIGRSSERSVRLCRCVSGGSANTTTQCIEF